MKSINLLGLALFASALTACGGSSDSDDNRSSESSSSSSLASSENSSPASEGASSISSASTVSSSAGGSSSSIPLEYSGPISNACVELATDPELNWREGVLQSDQEIVECLSQTLGRPVGYGENAQGGYDPEGGSKLTIITLDNELSVEEQLIEATTDNEPNWIVFDKADFAEEVEVGMYRLHCANAQVLNRLDATEAECLDYQQWCENRSITSDAQCLDTFFNDRLNEGDLPIRNPVIGSNKTIDGRMSNAFFRFSGFAIGGDSSGTPTQTSESVILTHLEFRGAGHTEDHGLDPDMIRSTGASRDIWIHKNSFELTGDSAFDVKVGARAITMSFNRVVDVERAALHGSSDSRTINENITTTMHHNAFVTRDERYMTFGNTGRRVPLIRRGTSHMFNNVFTNYRKDVLSVRVGASVLFQDNAFVINQIHQEKDDVQTSLSEIQGNLLRDVEEGNFRAEGSYLWFSDGLCLINGSTQTDLSASVGTVGDLSQAYNDASQTFINDYLSDADQDLVDYVDATAGKQGALPFNSPLAGDMQYVLSWERCSYESGSGGSSFANSSSSSAASSTPATPGAVLPFADDFEGAATGTLLTANYRALPSDPSEPLYVKVGGSDPAIESGALNLTASRVSLGHRPPRTNTSSGDSTGNGDFDLSEAYEIAFRVVSAEGSGNFQITIDNNTTSGGNSLHGSDSRIFNQGADTLIPGEIYTVESNIGTANSFVMLRTESSASVVIDDLEIRGL